MTNDVQDKVTKKYKGYSHMVGIVPSPVEGEYISLDVSGYIDPLTSMTIDELYQEIEHLPVGDEYVQGIVSFRKSNKNDEIPPKNTYHYFTP